MYIANNLLCITYKSINWIRYWNLQEAMNKLLYNVIRILKYIFI